MPQLDIVSYWAQYIWALLALKLLFFLIVLGILPILQQQLVLRLWAEGGFKEDMIEGAGSMVILRCLLNENVK